MMRRPGDARRGRAPWLRTVYLLVSCSLIVAYPFSSTDGRAIGYSIVSFGALLAVLIGLRSIEPTGRLPWWLLISALLVINIATLIGHIGTTFAEDVAALLDAFGNAIVLAAALVLVVRRGRNDIDGLIDATIVGFAVGGLAWAAVMPPGREADTSLASKVALFLVLFALTGVLGALMRLAATAADGKPALMLVSAALALALVANIVLVLPTATWFDVVASMMFMASYTCLGLFGLHPAAGRLAEAAPTRPDDALSLKRLAFLGLAVIVIPVVIGAQALRGGNVNGLVLLVGSLIVSTLVMLRIGRLSTQRARAERALKHQATHDGLTGLANRHEILATLDHELALGRDSTILFCDLNGFKTVNDDLGHAAGDQLLVEVARRLQASVRETDVVSRFGGDEFLILLRSAKLSDAYAICDRITTALARPIELHFGPTRVGASIGIAVAAGDADAEHLVGRADRAMYRAKRIQSLTPAVRVAEASEP
jgi:diguanylate cyclase